MNIEPKLQALEQEFIDTEHKLAGLNTREPNIKQAEVALSSLNTALQGGFTA